MTAPVSSAVVRVGSLAGASRSAASPSNNERCAPAAFAVALDAASGAPPIGASSAATERACWAASTSVGAMIAAWCPDWIATRQACRATSVLPEPTSPCRSRFIGEGEAIASAISSHRPRLREGR